jgi:hypothetical protein
VVVLGNEDVVEADAVEEDEDEAEEEEEDDIITDIEADEDVDVVVVAEVVVEAEVEEIDKKQKNLVSEQQPQQKINLMMNWMNILEETHKTEQRHVWMMN